MSTKDVSKALGLARSIQSNFVVCNRGKSATGVANPKMQAQALSQATEQRNSPTDLGDMNNTVYNNAALGRYELAVDGHIAATYYETAGGVITFVHTEVPSELGGKGIGSKLVKGALDKVRADGLQVIAQCPFVKAWIDKHPEYASLLKSA
jgi:predicted GNAT family acetyltransferase